MIEILILSIIQGVTEFLPISSSAHLILITEYLNFNSENLTLDISLHFGSLLAVIFFFKKEILNFIQNKFLFFRILIGSLPVMIFGFLLVKYNLIEQFRNIHVISATTIFFGILLYISDKTKPKKKLDNNFFTKQAICIGMLQCLSLIPGVSRSGITITGARFLNFNRSDAAKISFLFSIPTLIAVNSYGILKLIEIKNLQITIQNSWGIILSFVFSLITLNYFIKFIKKFSFTFFTVYRVILGIILLIYASS